MRKLFLSLLGYVLFAVSLQVAADELQLKSNHPDRYVVVEGDTLWGIASRFLDDPWRWPEIWHLNPQGDNPHLIYPGDVLGFITVTENQRTERRLTVLNRGIASRTVKLSPSARVTPLDTAIPAIPLDAIAPFLAENRVVAPGRLEKSAYILSAEEGRLIAGKGAKVYARGPFKESDEYQSFGIYRKGKVYVDPYTKEMLGVEALEIGIGKVTGVERDIATLDLQSSNEEVRISDRLMETDDRAIVSTFFPSTPNDNIKGRMISVLSGVSQVGQYNVVALNFGEREGVKIGNVFAVYKRGDVVKDRVTNSKIRLPSERAGLVMVFRTFDKVSYGIVLQATRPLSVMDEVKSPK